MYEDLLFYFYKVSKGLIESLNWEFPKICALEVFIEINGTLALGQHEPAGN